MTAQIIDGKKIASEIRADLARKVEQLSGEVMPVLAVVLVGDNEASRIYVRNKQKAAAEVGIGCEVLEMNEGIGENALLATIEELNENPHVNGIIVQLPLPEHINPLFGQKKMSMALIRITLDCWHVKSQRRWFLPRQKGF